MSNKINVILTIIIIGIGILAIKIDDNKKWGIIYLVLMTPIMLWINISAFNNLRYGNYKELVTKYGMKHTNENGYGMYSKDGFVFKYTGSSKGKINYEISDLNDKNIKYQDVVLNMFLGYQEGTAVLLNKYLKEISESTGDKSSIIVEGNHQKMEVTYDNINNDIKYTAVIIKDNKTVTTSDGEKINYYNIPTNIDREWLL